MAELKLGTTIGGSVAWHEGNDGSGSGLDADYLDGNHASAFALSGHTHNYAGSSSAGGAANSVANSVTFTSSGGASAGTTFNGSAAVTIDYATLGAAAASHTHSYLSSESDTLATVTGRGSSTATQCSFTKVDDHAISVGTIRGRAVGSQSGEYVHIYERVHIGSPGGWGSRSVPSYGLSTYGGCLFATDTGNVAIGYTSEQNSYKLAVNGAFAATSKSFLIPHPTKEGWKLRYGSLEGPENGVYIRGKLKGKNKIELPEYWTKLVHPDSITVTLTPIGKHQKLYVEDISNNVVTVANDGLFAGEINCFFVVYGERIDIDKLVVEYE